MVFGKGDFIIRVPVASINYNYNILSPDIKKRVKPCSFQHPYALPEDIDRLLNLGLEEKKKSILRLFLRENAMVSRVLAPPRLTEFHLPTAESESHTRDGFPRYPHL